MRRSNAGVVPSLVCALAIGPIVASTDPRPPQFSRLGSVRFVLDLEPVAAAMETQGADSVSHRVRVTLHNRGTESGFVDLTDVEVLCGDERYPVMPIVFCVPSGLELRPGQSFTALVEADPGAEFAEGRLRVRSWDSELCHAEWVESTDTALFPTLDDDSLVIFEASVWSTPGLVVLPRVAPSGR